MKQNDGEFLRTAQVARMLHVSPKTISRWAKEEKIPYVMTLGGHRRFPAEAMRILAEKLAAGTQDFGDIEPITETARGDERQ